MLLLATLQHLDWNLFIVFITWDIHINLGTGHHHSQHHPLNFRSLQGLENGKQKAQLSPTNSNSDHSSTTTSNKKCMNCNGGTSSPSTASTTSTGKVSHDMSHIYVPNF